MPRFLAELCEKDVLNILRDFYIKDDAIQKKVCSLAEFFDTLYYVVTYSDRASEP